MTESSLTEYVIYRELDDPISHDALDKASERSGRALQDLRDEEVDIEWVDSEVLETEDGDVAGTVCHYRAESQSAIRDHGDRAGLPVTRVFERGEPLEGE